MYGRYRQLNRDSLRRLQCMAYVGKGWRIWAVLSGAHDLDPPGYDPDTGWGRIDMGKSMYLASRIGVNPAMVVVPNEGERKVQWFNFQGGGFMPNGYFDVCLTPPGGTE